MLWFRMALSRRDWILLVLLTLAWGINWPIMKIGVRDFPPLTFRALCMLGGLPTLWLAARAQGVTLTIAPGQIRAIARLTVSNMLIWHVCVILGVRLLSSGRAAILGYTMPVWAVLCGLLFFGERVTRIAWLGVGFALAGARQRRPRQRQRVVDQPARHRPSEPCLPSENRI